MDGDSHNYLKLMPMLDGVFDGNMVEFSALSPKLLQRFAAFFSSVLSFLFLSIGYFKRFFSKVRFINGYLIVLDICLRNLTYFHP